MKMQEHLEKELPQVAVVLLNWNGWRDTIDCLESLLMVKDVNFEIVLVDNGSSDDSVKMIDNWIELHNIPKFKFSQPQEQKLAAEESSNNQIGLQRVVLYSLQENIGFCAGNNLGLRHTLANSIPYALILNNDTLVDPGFLSSLTDYAQLHQDAGLISGQIRYAEDPKRIWWMGGSANKWLKFEYLHQNQPAEEHLKEPFPTDWVSGCMTLIPMAVFLKIGGYDERFFIWCDEWDLSLKAAKAGYKLAVVPTSIIYHKVGRTLGIISPLTYYYSARNLLVLRHNYLSSLNQILFFSVYFPYKSIQSFFFTMRYHKPYYIFCIDIFYDFIFNHYGKWRRHDDVVKNMRK